MTEAGAESRGDGEAGDEPETPGRFARLKTWGRWLLFVLGIGAVVWLVRDAGPAQVWAVLVGAGVFVPVVMLGEAAFASMDVVALRLLYGERARGVPLGVWARSGMMAYGIMVLLPAGRAGGEVMRAAALAPYLGGARAAAGATFLQGVTLWGNTLVSIPCYVAVALASGPTSALAWLVLGNGLVTGVIGTVLLAGARLSRLGGWLGKRIAALSSHGDKFDASLREMPKVPLLPIAATLTGRLAQSLQYGVILLAVGGTFTLGGAFVGQAIHLVGAGFGDFVPNQAGITEGAYRIFAADLGLEHAVAQAISIALVHRFCQIFLAASSLAVGAVWKPQSAEASSTQDSLSGSASR